MQISVMPQPQPQSTLHLTEPSKPPDAPIHTFQEVHSQELTPRSASREDRRIWHSQKELAQLQDLYHRTRSKLRMAHPHLNDSDIPRPQPPFIRRFRPEFEIIKSEAGAEKPDIADFALGVVDASTAVKRKRKSV